MARGATLSRLLTTFRAECRLSLNPAHNAQARDAQVDKLQRVQEWLWTEFAWPHLKIYRLIPLQNGQRFYAPPAGTIIDRIVNIELRNSGQWRDLMAGIDPEHSSLFDSDLDQRAWPAHRWAISENEQIEVWPIPDQNANATDHEGYLKVWSIRSLKPLVDDGDTADLDDRLIVLYAAAEYLAAKGEKDAQTKLDAANSLFAKQRGNLTARRRISGMLNTPSGDSRPRSRVIANYRPPV